MRYEGSRKERKEYARYAKVFNHKGHGVHKGITKGMRYLWEIVFVNANTTRSSVF